MSQLSSHIASLVLWHLEPILVVLQCSILSYALMIIIELDIDDNNRGRTNLIRFLVMIKKFLLNFQKF